MTRQFRTQKWQTGAVNGLGVFIFFISFCLILFFKAAEIEQFILYPRYLLSWNGMPSPVINGLRMTFYYYAAFLMTVFIFFVLRRWLPRAIFRDRIGSAEIMRASAIGFIVVAVGFQLISQFRAYAGYQKLLAQSDRIRFVTYDLYALKRFCEKNLQDSQKVAWLANNVSDDRRRFHIMQYYLYPRTLMITDSFEGVDAIIVKHRTDWRESAGNEFEVVANLTDTVFIAKRKMTSGGGP